VDESSTATVAPAGPTDARRAAVVVGASAAALLLVAQLWNLATAPPELSVRPILVGLLWLAVPIAGVLLLHRGDGRGAGILAAAGALALPSVIAGWGLLAEGPWVFRVAQFADVALLVAGLLAWRSRDRARWTRVERASGPAYVVAAVSAVIGTVLPTTEFAVGPIGGDPWWRPLLLRAWNDGLLSEVAAFLLVPVVLAGLLWVAHRLRQPLAGAVAGSVAVTGLVGALFTLVQATVSTEFRLTPVGWLDLAAHAALLVIAARWWRAHEAGADGS
jgi:hypothetical protein